MKTRLVNLDDAAAGDILGADIVDDGGHVLLPRGALLADTTLAGLRRRGVHTVVLATTEAPDPGAELARRKVVERDLRMRFRHAGDGEATQLLFRATLEHLLESEA